MAGKGIEQSALYLEMVISFPVKSDPAWCSLQDLQKLRNIIVHRGGKHGSAEQQKILERLIDKYPQTLELRKVDGIHEQVWISMNLCRMFADGLVEFFERRFESADLPTRHGQLDS
jgi:hypothetical protein